MSFIDDIKLRTKILIPQVAMAAIFAGLLALSIARLEAQADASSGILDHSDPALADLIAADLQIQGLGYDIYRILSYQSGSDDENQAVATFQATTARGAALFDQAAAADPAQTEAVTGFKARFTSIEAELATQNTVAVTTNGFTLGSKDTAADQDVSASVARALVPIDHQIDAFSADLQAYISGRQAAQAAADATLRAQTARDIRLMIAAGLATLAGGLAGVFWLISARVIAPLNALRDAMTRLAGGDLAAEIAGARRRDEVGEMVKSVALFKQNAIRARALEAEAAAARSAQEVARTAAEAERAAAAAAQKIVVDNLAGGLARMASGDLVCRIEVPFEATYEGLRENFNASMTRLQSAMQTIAAAGGQVSSTSVEITAALDDLARRTERQAANLEQSSAALEEMTASIAQAASRTAAARASASAARGQADSARIVAGETVAAMQNIEASSREITEIIGVIEQIAFQTNLLALNAGVEAARAGDAGRGFAIVAQEVRALANRTAEAAHNITKLIAASGSHVQKGTALVASTGDALARIGSHVEELDSLIGELAEAAKTQSSGLAEISAAVSDMDKVTQQNAAMVEQSTAASHTMTGQAAELAQLIAGFKLLERGEESKARGSAPGPRRGLRPLTPITLGA
jgi:methyl-accepting chemotaxis protein